MGVEVRLYSFFNIGTRWGGWSTPRPGRFTPGIAAVPFVQEAGWAPEPVCTGAENLSSTGFRSPDRPARSESLYRLSYRGPRVLPVRIIFPIKSTGRISLYTMSSNSYMFRLYKCILHQAACGTLGKKTINTGQ
jgi:hypothetical protein